MRLYFNFLQTLSRLFNAFVIQMKETRNTFIIFVAIKRFAANASCSKFAAGKIRVRAEV